MAEENFFIERVSVLCGDYPRILKYLCIADTWRNCSSVCAGSF
ncbi:MAG: hypothetical protein ACI9PY_001001, partial [Ascidiaceihabitans sp.]